MLLGKDTKKKEKRKNQGFKCAVIALLCMIWKERNDHIFEDDYMREKGTVYGTKISFLHSCGLL